MIAALAAIFLALPSRDFEVPARPVSADYLEREAFDRRWTLPERRGGRDLAARFRRLGGTSVLI